MCLQSLSRCIADDCSQPYCLTEVTKVSTAREVRDQVQELHSLASGALVAPEGTVVFPPVERVKGVVLWCQVARTEVLVAPHQLHRTCPPLFLDVS